MTVRMARDWAYAAYEASRRGDHDAMLGAVIELVKLGPDDVAHAMRLWIDRAMLVISAAADDQPAPPGSIRVALTMEADSTGEISDIDRLPPENAWAARMISAYLHGDKDTWNALFAVAADSIDHGRHLEHVMTLLGTLTVTADAYAEQITPGRRCCLFHLIGPEKAAAQIAVAHLN